MPDDKDIRWTEIGEGDDSEREMAAMADSADDEAVREEQAWEAYRKWLRRGAEPKRSRGPIDPSLYTWKGYRNWAEEVKRNWSDRHHDDREDS